MKRLIALSLVWLIALPAQRLVIYMAPPDSAVCPTPTRAYLLTEGTGTSLTDAGTDGVNASFGPGGAAPTWVTGGLEFASGDYAAASSPTSADWIGSAFSVCAMIKPVAPFGARYGYVGEMASNHGWVLSGSIDGSFLVEFFGQAGGSNQRVVSKWGASPTTETVYHVCFVTPGGHDPALFAGYLNGAAVSVTNVSDTLDGGENLSYSGNELRLGTAQAIATSANGQDVLSIRIFEGRALSAAEARACCVSAVSAKGVGSCS